MADGLWWRSQSGSSSNVRRVEADATGSGDEAVPGEAAAEHVANGLDRDETLPETDTSGSPSAAADAPAITAGEEAALMISRAAENAAERTKPTRRGFRRAVVAKPSALGEPGSPLVETFEREGARRNDILMRTLERAQQATTEARRLRQAVAAAEQQARLATHLQDELRSRLEEEQQAEEANAAERRRAEAAALEREAQELDERKSENKRQRVEAYGSRVSAAAAARAESQRAARERAAEARAAADRAEAAARALEAAVDDVVASSEEDEKQAIAEAEARARAHAEAAAAELRQLDEQVAKRIEGFKREETERVQQRERANEQALAGASEHLATSQANLRELWANLAEVELAESASAGEVAECEAAVAEAEHLAHAAREAEARARRAREGQKAALDAARGANLRASAARGDAERAAATAKAAATEAAELVREAERLSAEAREAEQQTAASARALESPGSNVVGEVSALLGEDVVDLTAAEAAADGAGRNGADTAGSSDISSEIA